MASPIISQARNLLFKRTELSFNLESQKVPTSAEAQQFVADQTKSNVDSVVVSKIEGNFGSHQFTIYAHVYDSASDLELAFQKTRKQRRTEAAAAKEAAKAAKEAASASA